MSRAKFTGSLYGQIERLATVLITLYAIAVLAGWLLQPAPIAAWLAQWAPMQFTTALCFVLLGVGVLLGERLPAVGAGSGALVALIGAVSVIAHVAGANSGIDELLIHALLAIQDPHPNHMAPNPAFVFCLIGGALAIQSIPVLTGRLRPAAISMCIIAAAASVLSLVVIVFDSPGLGGWRAFAESTPTTAFSFAVVGTVLARALWRSAPGTGFFATNVMPSTVGLILLMVSFNLWQALITQSLSRLADETQQVTQRTHLMIAGRVQGQINLMERMAHRWANRPAAAGNLNWAEDAEMLLAHFPYIDGIGLTDENWVYRYATYRGGPRPVIGTRADRDEVRQRVFETAVAQRQVRLTPSLNLLQGGNGFVIVAPVPDHEKVAGLALAGIYFSDLFRPAIGGYPAGFAFSVSQGEREVYRSIDDVADNARNFIQSVELDLPGAMWRIAVWPTASYIDETTGSLPHLVLLFGVVTALLAWTTLSIAQLSATKNRQLSQMTHILESQVVERRRAEAEVRTLNTDLEERVRRRTQELEEINQELESFSYSVSHDLRAPLASIAGFSKMLADAHGKEFGPEAMHYMQRIGVNITRMGQIIDDLLDLARVSRSGLSIQDIDLSSLANDILARLLEEHSAQKVELRVESGLKVRADPNLMAIVLENLLSNALKFTGQREVAVIELGSEMRNDHRVHFVRDNGVGYDMAFAGKLFGVFQRLHSSTEFPGNGIGLATVKRIIARHHGEIWASSAPGKGAVFFFWLPE